MKIYLASWFDSRARLKPIRDKLVQMGHTVTSRWIDQPNEFPHTASYYLEEALRDLEDIENSDSIIVDTFDVTERGGREVELGYFIGIKGPVMTSIVGPKRNVFHQLAGAHFKTWEDCLKAYAIYSA